MQRLAAALGYRDFRVLWLGACTSSIGTWMQKVAQSWLVLDLTDSASYLALDAFLGELPILLFTLIGGVVADRRDRRALLLASQVVQMSSAFALAILVVGGWVQIWHVLALSFLSGCAQAFGGPAYQSLIPSLVHKDHLPNAVALNSIQFNIARVIGPLLAGVTLHSLGSASCFTVNGLSFLVVIAALLSLHTPHVAPTGQRRMLDELRTGLEYVRDEPAIRTLTVLALASTFLGVPLLTFLPVFARNVFHEGVGQYSQMMAWSGIGAVAGAMVVAWMGRFSRMGATALCVQVLFGVLTVAFAYSQRALDQLRAAGRHRRGADGGVLAVHVAGAAHRAQPHARPRDEHLHGGVPRRDAAGQPGDRPGHRPHRRAGRHRRQRRAAVGRRAVVSAPSRCAGRRMTFDIARRRTYLPKSLMHGSHVARPQAALRRLALALILIASAAAPGSAQTSRREALEAQRADKAKALAPYAPGKLESGLLWMEDSKFTTEAVRPVRGLVCPLWRPDQRRRPRHGAGLQELALRRAGAVPHLGRRLVPATTGSSPAS